MSDVFDNFVKQSRTVAVRMDYAFKILLSCPLGLSSQQISEFRIYQGFRGQAYDRIPHPDINLEKSISEIWDQRLLHNNSLFNALKFRYGGHVASSNADTDQDPKLTLHLGLTDYRTFVGTNLNPVWEQFVFPSEDDYIQCQHTSSPLGNGVIVKTSDDKILVLQRSNNVGEFPGHYVFPGGHPEPQEVGVLSYQGDSCRGETIKEKISKEMFDSILREVVEEIGVPVDALSIPIFIGISRRVQNVRPAAFFFIRCSLPSTEIQELYSNAEDGFESTHLYAVSMDELEKMASKMPGCHQGGFALYKHSHTGKL